jgi:hypothetical protein
MISIILYQFLCLFQVLKSLLKNRQIPSLQFISLFLRAVRDASIDDEFRNRLLLASSHQQESKKLITSRSLVIIWISSIWINMTFSAKCHQ